MNDAGTMIFQMLEQLLQEYSISIEIEKYLQSFEIVCLSELNQNLRIQFWKHQNNFKGLHRWEKNDFIIKRFYKSRLRSHINPYNCGFTDHRNGLMMKLFLRPLDQVVCLSITTFKNFHTYLEFPNIKYNKKMIMSQLYESRLPPFVTTTGTWRSYFLMISDGDCESLVCDYTDLSHIQLVYTNRSVPKLRTRFVHVFGNFDYPNYRPILTWKGPDKSCHLEQNKAKYAHCSANNSFYLYHITNHKMTQIFNIQPKNTDKIINHFYFVLQKKLIIVESVPWKKETKIYFYSLVEDKCSLITTLILSVKGSCLHTFYSNRFNAFVFIHNNKSHYAISQPETSKKITYFQHLFPDCLSIDYDENSESIVYWMKDDIHRYNISNFFVTVS
jgi:hypothetical protein